MTGKSAEIRTGRSSGLVRGEDARCRADETSRKGKGKGNRGKSEHEGKGGGVGRKGTQQVENLVMDEVQENHREDVRKLVEMMQKEEEEQEEQRGRVAPNMGAGGSHPQAMSVPERRETQGMRWADCRDERKEGEGQETERERQEEAERKKEQKAGRRRRDRGRGRDENAGGA